MRTVTYEISKEEYDQAQEGSAYDLIPNSIQMGYGAYCATVFEENGKYYLTYESGSSCD